MKSTAVQFHPPADRSHLFVPVHLLLGAACPLPRGRYGLQSLCTPAEQRVLDDVLAGLSNKEIASKLGRSEATIKNHVAAILRKCRVPSRARLLALAR